MRAGARRRVRRKVNGAFCVEKMLRNTEKRRCDPAISQDGGTKGDGELLGSTAGRQLREVLKCRCVLGPVVTGAKGGGARGSGARVEERPGEAKKLDDETQKQAQRRKKSTRVTNDIRGRSREGGRSVVKASAV